KRPVMVISGASSYPIALNFPKLGSLCKELNIHLHADIAHTAPYIASGIHPNVIPYADTITIDTGKNLRGPKGGILIYRTVDQKRIQHSIFPVTQSSPNQSAILAKAALFEYWTPYSLKEFSKKLIETAKNLENALKSCGLNVVYQPTDSHLILLDVSPIGITGKEAEEKLEVIGILSNRNMIPNETLPPWIGSGLRIGTSVLTILGYEDEDLIKLASIIGSALIDNETKASSVDSLLEKYHSSTVTIS
ncbi:MAG TPA: serine hydroxymethyltransferase, partial [Tenacibaculum sp.]|nr:serine hydroxymethyltransferase [Tenacibaculum sp.]